ncbi:MAG: isoprenylcysteine carboxylmethyltransferase family protein [Sphingobium sp.]|uniref:methanethiol S-methyltransferase n=1 Tax=Sphingobium sp. TaxID=1912891 RepID=UPI0029AFC443|nr:methanethiol S-methyltransferase [Sphingobium sp.]MDX3909868.1 isoprenylcysteine carboxylmethyltransferase family protein [Sphingobium sp.]
MARVLSVLFGVVAYCIFLATFLYLIAFVGDLPGAPRTVSHGPAATLPAALLTDVLLIALFGLQHSMMARSGFKRAWTRIIPAVIERSVYVLVTSAVLLVMFYFWLPIPTVVWSVTNALAAGTLWALFAIGWLIVLLSTFLINHFELFGLQQVYRNFRGSSALEPKFRQPFFYKIVRHPLYSGFLIAFWATPVMTVSHLLFAAGMTTYIVIAIGYEERDLTTLFGQQYSDYKSRVGMLAPRMGR